ncbi:X-ray repair cross-complementing protein 6-like, partial [Dendronephthya gigantea]|uniref:X-ray repair cross-complementing protein 6-like n=1 Tax=Dendronephthya gigantea TaxID=151771 RepID=UPI00106ABF01
NEKDLFGIVFFGTEKDQNPSNFKNIYIYQDLDMLDAQKILDVEDLLKDCDSFQDKYGHSSDFSLNDVLWTCSNMFSNSAMRNGHKRILLFTNNDDPHKNNQSLQRQAKTKATDLFDVGIDIELMPIKPRIGQFDTSLFYEHIVGEVDEIDRATMPDPAEKFEELLTRVQKKQYKKRPLCRVPLQFGGGVGLGVSVFNLCRAAVKSSYVNLDSRINEEVKIVSKLVCKTTGVELLPTDLKYFQCFGGDKVVFEKEEVDAIKSAGDTGLTLLGFKPRSLLKRYHHIRPAQFIYPDEKSISGSSRLFTALLKKCSSKDLVAICRFIPRRGASLKLVALIPQEEELDEQNVQVSPPGFHLIFLPFADDLRKLSYEDAPRANDDQVEKAKDIIKALTSTFDPLDIENPSIQKHYNILEALALDKDAPENFEDFSEPNKVQIDARLGNLATEFNDLVFPEGYVHDGKGKKRKATTGGSSTSTKRTKNDNSNPVDVKEYATSGTLNKLTVPVLKEFVKSNDIKCGTKKAELIEGINLHLGLH